MSRSARGSLVREAANGSLLLLQVEEEAEGSASEKEVKKVKKEKAIMLKWPTEMKIKRMTLNNEFKPISNDDECERE